MAKAQRHGLGPRHPGNSRKQLAIPEPGRARQIAVAMFTSICVLQPELERTQIQVGW